MNVSYDFEDHVALVTGAASGMGFATAKAFAAAGASVVLADIDEDSLSAATRTLTSAGHKAIGVLCDVARAVVRARDIRCSRDVGKDLRQSDEPNDFAARKTLSSNETLL